MTEIEYIDKTCESIRQFIASPEFEQTEETVTVLNELRIAMEELARQKEKYEQLYNETSLELENAKNEIEDMKEENFLLPRSDEDFLRGIEEDISCNDWQ